MSKAIEKLWLSPLILVLVVVLAFASVLTATFPLAYYFGLAIPYLAVVNVALIAFIAVKQRHQFLKICAVSILSLGLAYLWVIQTA